LRDRQVPVAQAVALFTTMADLPEIGVFRCRFGPKMPLCHNDAW